jgi:beta-aspartyl-peptidase (threonine type)
MKEKKDRKLVLKTEGGKMKRLFFPIAVILAIFIAFCFSRPASDVQKAKDEVQSILERQKASWNEGSIEGFMEYYWKSDDLTFQSGNKRLHGWNALLSRYKESYSGENMGRLDFTDIEIKVLSSDFAYVLGRWKLAFKDSLKEGLFTIILQRLSEGWRIIHDHTS